MKIKYLNVQSHSCFGIYSDRLLIFPAKVTNLHMRSSFYQSTRGLYQPSEPEIRCVIGNLIYCCVFFYQGATIRRDEATGAVIVARIMRGGAADRSGETNSIHTNINHKNKMYSISVVLNAKSEIISVPLRCQTGTSHPTGLSYLY